MPAYLDGRAVRRRGGVNMYWTLGLLPVVLLIGAVGGQAWTITMVYAAIWAVYAISFDLFSGYSGRINMGYAMFPGIAAYTSGICAVKFGMSPWLSMPLGVIAAGLLALLLGIAALRIKGVYFALASSILPLVLFQIVHIVDDPFGGEEGIWGVPPVFIDSFHNLIGAVALLGVVMVTSIWMVRGKPGLVLRAIKGGDLTAKALGINTFRTLLLVFIIAAMLGGAGGAYLAHFQMFVGPEVLFIVATLQVITFAQVGGPATIVGPLFASFLLVTLNEYLRDWSEIRLLVYFTVLVLLLRFAPDGLIMPALRRLRGGRREADKSALDVNLQSAK